MTTKTASSSSRLQDQLVAKLEAENAILKNVIAQERYLDEYFERYGYDEKYVSEKLHGCSETNNVWLAVHLTLKQLLKVEDDAARAPGLSNEDLRWNVARSASLRDFQNCLRALWAKANKSSAQVG